MFAFRSEMFPCSLENVSLLFEEEKNSSGLERFFFPFGEIFLAVWKNIVFSLEEYCFQFGGEETGAFRKAPPALIAFATVAILPARQFIDSLLIALNIESNFASGYSASIVGN